MVHSWVNHDLQSTTGRLDHGRNKFCMSSDKRDMKTVPLEANLRDDVGWGGGCGDIRADTSLNNTLKLTLQDTNLNIS